MNNSFWIVDSDQTCHAEKSWSRVFNIEIFILELRSIDRERTRSVPIQEISSLDHELGDAGVSERRGWTEESHTL